MLLIIDNQGGFAAEVAPYAEDLKVIFVRNHKQIEPDMSILEPDDVIIVPHKNMAANLKSRGFTNRIVTLNYKNYNLQELYIAATGHPRYGAYLDNPFELVAKSGSKKSELKVSKQEREQTPKPEQIEDKMKNLDDSLVKESKPKLITGVHPDSVEVAAVNKQGFKVVERIVPHKTERRADGRIAQGKIRIERKGHDGFIKERINLATGAVEVLEMQAPIDEVERYGTKGAPADFVPPAPELKPSPEPKTVEVETTPEKVEDGKSEATAEINQSLTATKKDDVEQTEKRQTNQPSTEEKTGKAQEQELPKTKPELKQKQSGHKEDDNKNRKSERREKDLEKSERKHGNRNGQRGERNRNNQDRKQGNRNEPRNNRQGGKQEGPSPKKLTATGQVKEDNQVKSKLKTVKVENRPASAKVAPKAELIEDKPVFKEESEGASFVDVADIPNFIDESKKDSPNFINADEPVFKNEEATPNFLDSTEDVPNFITDTKSHDEPNFISDDSVPTFVDTQESHEPNFVDDTPTAPVFKEDNGPSTEDAPAEAPSMSQLFDLKFE